MHKKILITGTNGFVGKNIKEYFSAFRQADEVLSPLRNELNLVDPEAVRAYLEREKPTTIIHCATIGGTRKTGYDSGAVDVVHSNLGMFLNLARCLAPDMRLLNLGSGAEYDNRAYLPKMGEVYFDAHVPADPYGFSKYAISKYIEKTENVVCLRIFGIYGKYEDYTFKFISNAIIKNLLGLPIVINQNVRFDYIYIDDFARIVSRFVDTPVKHKHYNVTPAASVDLLEIAEIINSLSDKRTEIRVINPGMNREYTGDNSRLLKEFPTVTFTPYSEAIKALFNYYKDNLDSLDLKTVREDPFIKNCRSV